MDFYDESSLRQLYYDSISSGEILKYSEDEILKLCVLMFCVKYPFREKKGFSHLTTSIKNEKGHVIFRTQKIYYNNDCLVTYYCNYTEATYYTSNVAHKQYYIVKYKGIRHILSWKFISESSGDWVQFYLRMKKALNHESL